MSFVQDLSSLQTILYRTRIPGNKDFPHSEVDDRQNPMPLDHTSSENIMAFRGRQSPWRGYEMNALQGLYWQQGGHVTRQNHQQMAEDMSAIAARDNWFAKDRPRAYTGESIRYQIRSSPRWYGRPRPMHPYADPPGPSGYLRPRF